MNLDEHSSARLSSLRFPLIVGVIFIHAYHAQVGFSSGIAGVGNSGFISEFVRSLISQGIARVAIPLFFVMSGYSSFLWFARWAMRRYTPWFLSVISGGR